METSSHRAAEQPDRHPSYFRTSAPESVVWRSSRSRPSRPVQQASPVPLEPPLQQQPPVLLPSSDTAAMMLLHCLFAMVFAAAVMGLLHCLGFVVRSSTSCPLREGDSAGVYSACEIWQDTRSVLSFVLGAVLCCFMTRNADGQVCPPGTPEQAAIAQEAAGAEKLQLYACLL